MRKYLTVVLLLGSVQAQQTQPTPSTPVTPNQSTSVPATPPMPSTTIRQNNTQNINTTKNYALNLPELITQSQQVVLLTRDIQRADVAEAIRKAITGRGTEVVLMTTKESLLTKNSYTFRLALMRTKTFAISIPIQTEPILLLDGEAYVGPGIQGRGIVRRMTYQESVQTVKWIQQNITKFEKTGEQINPVTLVKAWYKVNNGINLW